MSQAQQNKLDAQTRLKGLGLTLGYDGRVICKDMDVSIPDHKFTVIIGPNGCGKSTLLRSLCRLLKPEQGTVYLGGQDIHRQPTRQVAKTLGLLPQSAQAPSGIRVIDLVARGRYPHQGMFKQWRVEDQKAIEDALRLTGTAEFAERDVDALSGGQRQRVWIAMALAQETPILLLDEPTTYLDIAHQIELLDLFKRLNQESGRTLIAVLHDLNQACRYADHLIAMAGGEVKAVGPPAELITESLVSEVFGLQSMIIEDPVSHTPMVIPRSAELS
ncbi:ABC transporter ATP-binding protein [Thaumasiovibrio subtropicus]|uniref:ABC transporter ATP-binding protein n=1 Tax=Thaumasiovibrio subtropicus TaxID=1891207 RepID=UPI000B35C0A3|nr:ABC transporter ATP-binding protein [Thaumasiovibrio subtropicus]